MKNLMPLVFIGLSIAVFFLFIDKEYKEMQRIQGKIELNKKTLELSEKLESENDQLNQRFKDIGAEHKERLEKILPDNVDNVHLIIDIENIVANVGGGLDISNISLSEKNTEGGKLTDSSGQNYGTIGIGFSVSTTYEIFKELMETLEDSLRLVDIESLTVSAGDGLFYNFSVSLNTYWLK